jgi:serine/tyrosine/threonine adenylyltransferase
MHSDTDGGTTLNLGLTWLNRYASLGEEFSQAQAAQPLPSPYWVGQSPSAAKVLGLKSDWLASGDLLQALSGNSVIAGTNPRACVYSGHQFGVWAGQLGDGRALWLGETETGWEVQLKGAGPTPYSRRGDGRAVLRSSIREFLCSEAMHALGIPTTRALCVTGSDAPVWREEKETAAVVTRMAPSFIRFGHFEHFSYQGETAQLKALADFVIDHHYPQCRQDLAIQGNPYAGLLQAVSEKTAAMVAAWQGVGFCHGVMNTDNMSILGLTLDYGPFQFMDSYNPGHICNHSDTQGRYAFNKQAHVAYWNLYCLGQALLPLIDDQALALSALASYKTVFPDELQSRLSAKLGLQHRLEEDRALIETILALLAADRVDHTIFWRRLTHFAQDGVAAPVSDLFLDRSAAQDWLQAYAKRLTKEESHTSAAVMRQTNPAYVLRNHLAEQAIQQAKQKDFSELERLRTLLDNPFEEHAGMERYADFAPDWASTLEISCSS